METFAVRDLSFAYPEQRQDTLSHLTFSIPQGQFVTLCVSSSPFWPLPGTCGERSSLRAAPWRSWTTGLRASASASCSRARRTRS